MHFPLSQSILLARVHWYKQDVSFDTDRLLASIAFSPVAILITVYVGGVLTVVQILHSLRPLDNPIPIHSNSSAIISAMCHLDYNAAIVAYEMLEQPDEDSRAALGPIVWGAVVQPSDEYEIGHCSFTGDIVEPPIPGRRYQ